MKQWEPSLFILPHCDDELFAFPILELLDKKSTRFIFLTSNSIRRAESKAFLSAQGFDIINQVHFLDDLIQIEDGKVYQRLNEIQVPLFELARKAPYQNLITVAYEGGHHDHDACFFLTYLLSKADGAALFTYPLYNATKTPLFRVMNDDHVLTSEAARTIHLPYTFKSSLRMLRSILHYRSQRKTFLGLLPGILRACFFRRSVKLKHIGEFKWETPPHEGALFYEKRFKVDYKNLRSAFESIMIKKNEINLLGRKSP